MATRRASGGERYVALELSTAHANAAGGQAEPQSESNEGQPESSADVTRKKLKRLNAILFCVAFLEWAGNIVGTVGFIWATVVLLGGFCSLLNRMDFWFSAIMIFVEGSRVFIRNDASVNQWLFGSTSAFRWENLSSPHMLELSGGQKIFTMITGVAISFTPFESLPEIVAGILKVAFLVIISQLLIRESRRNLAGFVLFVLGAAAVIGGIIGAPELIIHEMKKIPEVGNFALLRLRLLLKILGLLSAWIVGTVVLAILTFFTISRMTFMRKTVPLLCLKVTIASGLACLPFLEPLLASYYRYVSISISVVLLILSCHDIWEAKQASGQQEDSSCGLLLQILDTILPILLLWSLMFPFPGMSLKISFYMLFTVISSVLVANLQIPVAFLQVLLSIMRLRNLLDHRHHDYNPPPKEASINFVPSIVVFFVMELCQGSSYILATILGLISLFRRRSLLRDLELKEEWGEKAVNLYYRQAYQARTEKGLLPSVNSTPSLQSFAIESLGSTSSAMQQIIWLCLLKNFLEHWDSKSKMDLISEMIHDSKKAVPTLIDMAGSTLARDRDVRQLAATIIDKLSSGIKISEFPGMLKMVSLLLDAQNSQLYPLGLSILEKLSFDPDNCAEIAKDPSNIVTKVIGLGSYLIDENTSGDNEQKIMAYCSAIKFVRRLAIKGGKPGARFRQELLENPYLLQTLQRILSLGGCQKELWELVIDIIANLALDEAARQEIGSTQAIIGKLVHAFLRQDDPSLRNAAGKALANLTMVSADNCWAILLVHPEYNLVKRLIRMLEDKDYICVAANLLHNLCANCRERMIDLGAHVHLKSALPKVMEIIKNTTDAKQFEAALCLASQIGYPEYFAQMLESDAHAAKVLVDRLVKYLKSEKPCPLVPRIRRVLVEEVISIMELCPDYIKIFREKGALDAFYTVKGTPSRLEKYRVFLDGEGVVEESLLMRDLVDKAKMIILQADA